MSSRVPNQKLSYPAPTRRLFGMVGTICQISGRQSRVFFPNSELARLRLKDESVDSYGKQHNDDGECPLACDGKPASLKAA